MDPIDAAIAALEEAKDDPRVVAFVRSADRANRKARKQAHVRATRQGDRALDEGTTRARALPLGSEAGVLGGPRERLRTRRCYVCKSAFRLVDGHHHRHCPPCAATERDRRHTQIDLTGRRALLVGGRVKIGFELVRMLLRDGAHVTMTTRFPNDAARRFGELPEFETFRDRLVIAGLDLLRPGDVVAFADNLVREGNPLDIVIHNAAQTIRRPPAFEAHWREVEAAPLPPHLAELVMGSSSLARTDRLDRAAPMASLDGLALASDDPDFPRGLVDVEGLPLDLRTQNTWRLRLGEVAPVEMAEVLVANALGPSILTSRLEPLLLASPHAPKLVIFVSAVEGQFARNHKTPFHPHTNMAKAALHMLVRTSSDDMAKRGIAMCAVDTGWVTDEDPFHKREANRARGFVPPLDCVDGAARVYDPIRRAIAGEAVHGVFWKDYAPAEW